jgi:type II secretory pathway pseudopilin PulG
VRKRPGAREAGYNLVILAVLVTVMTILVAAALPLWSTRIRRDKEEELRFRGLQYAEAIRVFQARYGRLPVRLEELIQVKPRTIRQLWRDPMAEDGRWGLIFEGVPPGGLPGAPPGGEVDPDGRPDGRPGQAPPPPPTGPDSFDPDEEGSGRRRQGFGREVVTVGPIIGVFSLSQEESFSSYFGAETYREWRFTTEVFQRPSVEAGITPQSQVLTQARWIGRPWRPFVQQAKPIGAETPGVPGFPGKPGVPGLPGVGGQPPFGTPPGGRPGSKPGGRPGGRPGGGDQGGGFDDDDDFDDDFDDDDGFPADDDEPGGGRPGQPGFPGFPGFPGSPGGGGGGGGQPGGGGGGGGGGQPGGGGGQPGGGGGGGEDEPFPDNESVGALAPLP